MSLPATKISCCEALREFRWTEKWDSDLIMSGGQLLLRARSQSGHWARRANITSIEK